MPSDECQMTSGLPSWADRATRGRHHAAKVCPIMSYRSNPPVAVDCVRERCAAWFWPHQEGEYGQGYCKLIGPGRQV
jgi:hypothetical protein